VTTTVLERTSTLTKDAVIRAYVYAIDPTPGQISTLRSHVGGSRFAYNALLGLVKENWDENRAKKDAGVEVANDDYIDTGHFGLLYLWAAHRDELAPWWGRERCEHLQRCRPAPLQGHHQLPQGKVEVPAIQAKGQGGSVRFTNQSVRLTDSHHVRVNRIGEVKTYESTRKLYRHLDRGTGNYRRVSCLCGKVRWPPWCQASHEAL
jgi:putative transposase